MAKVLQCDNSMGGDSYVSKTLSLPAAWYLQFDAVVPSTCMNAVDTAAGASAYLGALWDHISFTPTDGVFLGDFSAGSVYPPPASLYTGLDPGAAVAGVYPAGSWHTIQAHFDGTTIIWSVDSVAKITYTQAYAAGTWDLIVGGLNGPDVAGEIYYIADVRLGTTDGGVEVFSDDFSSGDTSAWTATNNNATVIDDPFPPPTPTIPGRVLIAWDDGPLVPNPTYTAIDQGGAFPEQFVSGYDIKVGRQTLLAQTDTGTATVYINDHEFGLFDDRNLSSPYQGKLSGRQIKLQLYDPVAGMWEEQFGGLINTYSYDIDGSAADANGDPINASIQIECVDMFDYLNGYGLTPGLDGVAPPSGAEDGVYYAATAGPVHDRIVEILTDAGIDSTRYLVASGNTKIMAVKYDPGESALTALRDAADAEFPFIANLFVDRHGKLAFRGRGSRFDPDIVAAEPGSDWDFTRWAVGDEKAIIADSTRAQMRGLSFSRDRSNIINVAMCWPQGLLPADMPNQVFADASSITGYGKHSAPPMSDLLTGDYAGPGTLTPGDGKQQCYLYAKLLVKNQAFPREEITSLQVKAISPGDYRAARTWAFITQSDISHIVNVRVGYPGGTGFTGTSPADDYYIEGRSLTVRPLNPVHDYVEYNVEVTPAVWSMDTHGVFPT